MNIRPTWLLFLAMLAVLAGIAAGAWLDAAAAGG